MPAAAVETPFSQDMCERVFGPQSRITILTGAGISTECGVPDFRSPGSPWRRNKPIDFATFVADPAVRAEAWRRKFAMDDLYAGAKPGRAHRALTALAGSGRLRAVLTQNIDGLHQASGFPAAALVELHGNGTYAHCLACGDRFELAPIRARFEAVGVAPVCACGGLVKAATIGFGQSLAPAVLTAAVQAAVECDVFVAVGSSLVVRPAASLPSVARKAGARLVIVNREPTALDAEADDVIQADAGEFLSRLACWHRNNTSPH